MSDTQNDEPQEFEAEEVTDDPTLQSGHDGPNPDQMPTQPAPPPPEEVATKAPPARPGLPQRGGRLGTGKGTAARMTGKLAPPPKQGGGKMAKYLVILIFFIVIPGMIGLGFLRKNAQGQNMWVVLFNKATGGGEKPKPKPVPTDLDESYALAVTECDKLDIYVNGQIKENRDRATAKTLPDRKSVV